MSWKTNRRTRQPYKTIPGRSISDLEENPQYAEFVAVGLVADLNDRDDLEFNDRDTDVEQLLKQMNVSPDEDFGAYFVKKSALEAGDIGDDDVYWITGTVPSLSKQIYQIVARND